MAITKVTGQFVEGSTSVNANCSVTITGTVSGNTLLIFHFNDGTGDPTISSITCSGETLALLGSTKSDYNASISPNGISSWYAIKALSSGGSKQIDVTLTGSPQFINKLCVWELSGCDTTNTYDSELLSNGTSSVISGSISTVGNNCAVFAYGTGTSSKPGAGTGFTGESVSNWSQYSLHEFDEDVGAAGSKTVAFTVSESAWGLHAVGLKAAGAAPSGIVRQMLAHNEG